MSGQQNDTMMMNSASSSFENQTTSSRTASLTYDFNLQPTSTSQTVYKHLSNLEDHLHALSKLQARAHPLSANQPPQQDHITTDLLAVSASLQNYHATLSQLLAPMNGEPMVLGAERFVSRSKEHSGFLSRLESRKRAIQLVKEEIQKVQVKKGGVRRDLRFSEKRIETLVKELGLMVFADEVSPDLPSHTRRLTIGGKIVVLDIDFAIPTDSAVIASISKITLSIAPADDESISSLGPAAAEVLTTNFQTEDGPTFLRNLTNIAKWDGCSYPPNEGLNCFAVLKGVEDALELIYGEERKVATESQVLLHGWGKPSRNQYNLVGLSITYTSDVNSVLIGVEPRRPQYMHPPLQTAYLPSENPFTNNDEMFPPPGPTSAFLSEALNWLEPNLDGEMSILNGVNCSFAMDLNQPIVMSVEAARRICQIIGYGGWENLTTAGNEDVGTVKDTTLEEILFDGIPASSSVTVNLPNEEKIHRYEYISVRPIAARRIEKIPFSHPQQIFPILRVLRQWAKLNLLLRSCFPLESKDSSVNQDIRLDDLLNGSTSSALAVTVSTTLSPLALLVVFFVGSKRHSLKINILENGELDVDVDEVSKERVSGLIEGAGIGVGIELLRKELTLKANDMSFQ